MNYSAQKLGLQILKCSGSQLSSNITKNHLSQPQNNLNKFLIARNILTRPKELDELRKRVKKREEEERYKEYERSSDNYSEPIGPYGYFLLSIPIITFGLGTWQVGRRQWKIEMIKSLEERLSRAPVEIPENLDDLAHLEYCPIKVRGEFMYDHEFVVGPRSLIVEGKGANEGKGNLISSSATNRGYNIITPFKVEDRDLVILVNRGWLPNKYKLEEERKKCKVEGPIEITGVNRLNETRPQFVNKNEPERSFWHYRDIYQMADQAQTDPIFLDRIETDPGPCMPIGSQTRVNVRNEHLSYIITWYGLSALTGFYWYRIFILKRPIF